VQLQSCGLKATLLLLLLVVVVPLVLRLLSRAYNQQQLQLMVTHQFPLVVFCGNYPAAATINPAAAALHNQPAVVSQTSWCGWVPHPAQPSHTCSCPLPAVAGCC
jgi:hypothetical protein